MANTSRQLFQRNKVTQSGLKDFSNTRRATSLVNESNDELENENNMPEWAEFIGAIIRWLLKGARHLKEMKLVETLKDLGDRLMTLRI
jgi:hypothetical protein